MRLHLLLLVDGHALATGQWRSNASIVPAAASIGRRDSSESGATPA